MVTIGLLTNSITSANYGVNALSISNIILIEKCIAPYNVEHRYIMFGDSTESNNRLNELRKLIDELNRIDIQFVPELEFRKARSFIHFSDAVKECDVVFDTSGGDSYSDIYGHNRMLHQIIPKLVVLCKRRDLVFTPQTIGPFENWVWKRLCRRIMRESVAVFARDCVSYQLASEEFRLKNAYNVTDMAMALPYKKKDNSSSTLKIGLNVSGLLYNGGYTLDNQFSLKSDYAVLINTVIEMLLKEVPCKIYLIPHVITTGIESDNEVCELLKEKYPSIEYTGYFNGPIEAKSFIASMDCFIGSRMHSTIAAISSGVPVIPLSYSRKFEGLFDSIEYNECISLKTNGIDEVVKIIKDKIMNIDDLKQKVNHSALVINKKMNLYCETLSTLMEKYIR